VTVDSKTFKLLPNHILHSALGLVGRGTVTVKAKSNDDVPRDPVIKIYSPEELRPNEATVISDAIERGENDPDITTIFLQFLLHRTLSIARGLSETRSVQVRTPGYCVSLSSPSFNPLPTLTGFLFIRAWLQCVRCGCTEHGSPAFILTQSC
jgi:hypothetical protein